MTDPEGLRFIVRDARSGTPDAFVLRLLLSWRPQTYPGMCSLRSTSKVKIDRNLVPPVGLKL